MQQQPARTESPVADCRSDDRHASQVLDDALDVIDIFPRSSVTAFENPRGVGRTHPRVLHRVPHAVINNLQTTEEICTTCIDVASTPLPEA